MIQRHRLKDADAQPTAAEAAWIRRFFTADAREAFRKSLWWGTGQLVALALATLVGLRGCFQMSGEELAAGATGVGLSLLLQPIGYATLVVGIVLTLVMHWVIDPKLKVVSGQYEKRQREYLEELERKARWEANDG